MTDHPNSSLIAEYVDLLGGVEMFAGLDRVALAKLAAHLEPLAVRDGEALFRQGDPPDGLYIVCRGMFGIFGVAPGNFGETRLETLERGEPIGEMALLTGEGRSATVRADGDGEVLRLERAQFVGLLRQDPSVAASLAATLSRRLRAADSARLGAPSAAPPRRDAADGERSAPAVKGGPAQAAWWPGLATIGLGLAVLALALGWGVPPPEGLSPAGWHALLTLLALVPLLALEALPDGAAALGLAAIWVVGGVAPPKVALGGYATAGWVLTVTVFAVGAAAASSGLLYRVALWVVAQARGGFPGQVTAVSLVGLIVGAAVPNSTGRVALIAPATTEMAEALGYAPGSRAAAGLAMAVLAGFGQMVAPFLTSSSTGVLAYALLPESARAGLNWATWTVRALPAHAVILFGLLAVIIWFYRPEGEAGAAARPGQPAAILALQRALLGSPSRQERITAGVMAGLLAGFATQPLHRIDPAWIGVAALVVLAATGVLSADTLRTFNWSFVLLFGILASMADVFAASGLDRWLAAQLAGTLGGLAATPVLFVGGLTLFCFGISLILRWQAAVPLLLIALGPIAGAAGIDPWVVAIIALTGCCGFFLPFQSTIYQALYHGTGGRLFSHAQARPLAIAYALFTLLGLCASVPFWHAMGLL